MKIEQHVYVLQFNFVFCVYGLGVFDFEGFGLLLLLMADWFSEMVDVVVGNLCRYVLMLMISGFVI